MKCVQNVIIVCGYVIMCVLLVLQDFNQGMLVLLVVLGWFCEVVFFDLQGWYLVFVNVLLICSGGLFNLCDIEQGLENLQCVFIVSVDIKIVLVDGEGVVFGQSDLQIDWMQCLLVCVSVILDDVGSFGIGKLQVNVMLLLDNLLGLNELFYVSVGCGVFNGRGKDIDSWIVYYDVFYGYWLFGVIVSVYDYSQNVVGVFECYDYSGCSCNVEVWVDWLLLCNVKVKFSVYVCGWQCELKNYIDDIEIEVQCCCIVGWELGLIYKQFIGIVMFDVSVVYWCGMGVFYVLCLLEEMVQLWDLMLLLEGILWMKLVIVDVQFSVLFQLGK